MAAVRDGDDRAFEGLYARYQRRISAYVLGMVKDHGRAEDITQEVFISALRRMRETDRAIAFKPWIYEIAKNACIDQFRRSRRAEEISMDAGDGLGHADHGRLVAAGPTPDDAVDTKQQLDHLCGAFGGLSDSHHEILVLREFEGLSYREIGDRMGLSRPGVESTLFRARKRLSEEYDELVSGRRCISIQSIIAAAGCSALGTRDQRRLARHIAHCQPCRRMAVASGLDAAAIARRPVRHAIGRAAAFLPVPAFMRSRFFAGSEQMVPVSEPMAAAWSKSVAVAATIVVAGVGAGIARSRAASGTRPRPRRPSPPPSPPEPRRPRRRTARGGRSRPRRGAAPPRSRRPASAARTPRSARHAARRGSRRQRAREHAARGRCAGGGQPDPRHAAAGGGVCSRRAAARAPGRRAFRRSSCPRSTRASRPPRPAARWSRPHSRQARSWTRPSAASATRPTT